MAGTTGHKTSSTTTRKQDRTMHRLTKTTRNIFTGTLVAAAALAAPLSFAGAANAATVPLTNGGVETADIAYYDGFHWVHVAESTLDGWTVGGPGATYPGGTGYGEGIDIVSNDRWQAAEGSRSIDLNAYNPG